MIEFIVPGQPVAKARPRFARRGTGVVAYTPNKTAAYERLVERAAVIAMAGRQPTMRPIKLVVNLILQIPASWSSRRRALAIAGEVHATKKPDADNVLKSLKDACNGIVWGDDAQVVSIEIVKAYGITPCASISIFELDGDPA